MYLQEARLSTCFSVCQTGILKITCFIPYPTCARYHFGILIPTQKYINSFKVKFRLLLRSLSTRSPWRNTFHQHDPGRRPQRLRNGLSLVEFPNQGCQMHTDQAPPIIAGVGGSYKELRQPFRPHDGGVVTPLFKTNNTDSYVNFYRPPPLLSFQLIIFIELGRRSVGARPRSSPWRTIRGTGRQWPRRHLPLLPSPSWTAPQAIQAMMPSSAG